MVIFIVPAFNEAENITALLAGMREKIEAMGRDALILIVDDGSSDHTGELARASLPARSLEVIRHETNRGVAEAFRTGFRRALAIAGPDDILVTKEADNTSDLSILEVMLSKIDEGYDLVLASCFAPEGKVVGSTFDRHLLSFGANWLLRTFFPIAGVHTYSSFYRAYRAQMLRRAFGAYGGGLIECRGFACMVELLVRLQRFPIRITEVPMVLQCNRRKGASKMVRRSTIREYLTLIRREGLRSREQAWRIQVAFEAARQRELVQPVAEDPMATKVG